MDLGPLDQAEVTTQLANLGPSTSTPGQGDLSTLGGEPLLRRGTSRTVVSRASYACPRPCATSPTSAWASWHRAYATWFGCSLPWTSGRLRAPSLLFSDPADELVAALHSAVDTAILTVDWETSTYRFRHALLAEAVLDQFLPGERPQCTRSSQRRWLSGRPCRPARASSAITRRRREICRLPWRRTWLPPMTPSASTPLERPAGIWSGHSISGLACPTQRTLPGVPAKTCWSAWRENLGRAGDFDRAVAFATAALAEPEIASDPERGAEVLAANRLVPPAGEQRPARRSRPTRRPAPSSIWRLRREVYLDWRPNMPWRLHLGPGCEATAGRASVAARRRRWRHRRPGSCAQCLGRRAGMAGRVEDSERDLREALELARVHGSIDDLWRATTKPRGHVLLRAGRTEESLGLCRDGDSRDRGHGTRCGARCDLPDYREPTRCLPSADGTRPSPRLTPSAIASSLAGGPCGVRRPGSSGHRPRRERSGRLVAVLGRTHGQGQDDRRLWHRRLVVAENAAWSEHYDEGRAAIAAASSCSRRRRLVHRAAVCSSASGLRPTAAYPLTRVALAARRRMPGSGRTSCLRRWRMSLGPTRSRPGWRRRGPSTSGSIRASPPARRLRSGRPYATAGGPCDTPIPRRTRACASPSRAGHRQPASRGTRALLRCNAGRAARSCPSGSVIADVARRGGIGASRTSALDGLTAREREILAMVVAGMSNRDIATALFHQPEDGVSACIRTATQVWRQRTGGPERGRAVEGAQHPVRLDPLSRWFASRQDEAARGPSSYLALERPTQRSAGTCSGRCRTRRAVARVARSRFRVPHPDRHRSLARPPQAKSRSSSQRAATCPTIAIGIGLHNLGEGLAIDLPTPWVRRLSVRRSSSVSPCTTRKGWPSSPLSPANARQHVPDRRRRRRRSARDPRCGHRRCGRQRRIDRGAARRRRRR